MTTKQYDKTRKVYINPEIIQISLDSEISLALESFESPPGDAPGETQNLSAPDYFNSDPFKTA